MPTSARPARLLAWTLLLPCLLPAAARAQDRCERYATRAVQQYTQMMSTPSCQVNADLRWQDNYQNHLFACRHVPKELAKAEEAARDQHLTRCGYVATPVTPAAAPAPVTPATAPAAPPVNGGQQCNPSAPGFVFSGGTYGSRAEVAGGVLSYLDAKTSKKLKYQVVRPPYYAEYLKCAGIETIAGHWITLEGAKEDRFFLVDGQGLVSNWPVPAAKMKELRTHHMP